MSDFEDTKVPRHFHIYIAGDNPGRRGPPRAFLLKGGKLGYRSKTAAHTRARFIEPDPARRYVVSCANQECKVRRQRT